MVALASDLVVTLPGTILISVAGMTHGILMAGVAIHIWDSDTMAVAIGVVDTTVAAIGVALPITVNVFTEDKI